MVQHMDETPDEPIYAIGSNKPVGYRGEKQTDAWHRQLNDGRVEVMCSAPGFRLRLSAPEEQAWEAVEMFERWTGLQVTSDRRPRRKPKQIAGQLSMTELQSEA
jgi:hypothetical protein